MSSDQPIPSIKQLAKQSQWAQVAVVNNQIAISDRCFSLQELNQHLKQLDEKSWNFLLSALCDLFLSKHAQLEYMMMFFSQIMSNYVRNFDQEPAFASWHDVVDNIIKQHFNDITALQMICSSWGQSFVKQFWMSDSSEVIQMIWTLALHSQTVGGDILFCNEILTHAADLMLYCLSMTDNFHFCCWWAPSDIEWMARDTWDSFWLNPMLILNRAQLQAFDLHFLLEAPEVFIASMIQQGCASTVHSFLVSQAVLTGHTVPSTPPNSNQWGCFLVEPSATTSLKWQQEIDRMRALYQGNTDSQQQLIISLLSSIPEQGQVFMKRVLSTNLKIQTREWAQVNAAAMSGWNLINASDSDHSHGVSKASEQMEDRSCRSSVNREHGHEKARECEHECEKNREWGQDEKHEHEHRERDSSIDIGDGGRESESCQPSPSTQLTPSVYPANSQHTAVPGFHTVLQITWAENFGDSEPKTINTWEETAFCCNPETCHLSDWVKTLLQSFNLHSLATLMMMCNFIHLMLSRGWVCKHHGMLVMNKLGITGTDSSTVMLQMLDSVVRAIAVLHLSNADTGDSV